MTRSRKSRAKKMSQADLKKAADLLHEAEQQNLTDGQAEVEAILRKRNIIMFPQILLRGGKQFEQIVFLPAQTESTKPLPISQPETEEELEEEPTE